MNQHRKMADRLVRLANLYEEDSLVLQGISRARYNRYYQIKSKLRLLKEEFLQIRNAEHPPKARVKYNYGAGAEQLLRMGMNWRSKGSQSGKIERTSGGKQSSLTKRQSIFVQNLAEVSTEDQDQ